MQCTPVKKRSLLVLIFFITLASVTAQVKIGSAGNANSNAVLELDGGVNKGLLLPRLNSTQMNSLTTAPDGLIVYNTSDGFLYLRKAAAWRKITDDTNAAYSFSLPYVGTTASTSSSAFVINHTGPFDAIYGAATVGDGITGISGSGNGGFFNSYNGGNALVTNNGNVGIGTLNPAFPLDINSRPRIRSNGPYNSAGIWYDKIYSSGQSSFAGTLNDSAFGIYGGGSWKFVFDHINNNFGINTIDPKAPLSFSNATGNKLDVYYASVNSRYGIGLQAGLLQLYSAGANDDIAFGYGSSTVFAENMRIKGNGNVGIGSNNPDAKLLVNGTLKITDGTQGNGKVLTSDANGKASWQNGNANTGFKVLIATTDFPTNTFVFTPFRLFGNTIFDDGNNYRFSNEGYYTPSAGLYHFDLAFLPSATPVSIRSDAEFWVSVYVNGVENSTYKTTFSTGQSMPNINYSCNIKLNANDRVHVVLFQTSGVTIRINYSEFSFFSGYKVY